jgi:ribonuclease P protein component
VDDKGWIRGKLVWVRRSREQVGPIYVVRRKVGHAVVRNLLKRRLRSITRALGHCASAIVVLVRDEAAAASFQDLLDEYSQLVEKLDEGVPE